MPLYEYKCIECEACWEEMHKIDERDIPLNEPCPKCNVDGSVIQQIGASAVIDSVRLGVTKPPGAFRDRMKQIQHNLRFDRKAKLKDY